MNIKTSDSAAKNKFFLGLWFVFFAGLILFVNWMFGLPVDRNETIRGRLADIEKQITRVTALHADFLLKNDKEDNLFTTAGKNAQNEIKIATGIINEHLGVIRNRRSLARKAAAQFDELSSTLAQYEAGMNNLVLITAERGSRNSGIVSRWLAISQNMLNSSVNSTDASTRLYTIKQLESGYLLTRDVRTLQDISVLAEEIRNELTMEGEGIDINDIDSYIVLTGNLVSIEKRMGRNDSQGIVQDIENSIQRLPSGFDSLSKVIHAQLVKSARLWNIGRLLALLLIIALFIYLFIKFFALIDPLKKVAAFSQQLSLGELPENGLIAGSHMDMKVVSESLHNHVTSLKNKFAFTRALNEDRFDDSLTLSGSNDALGKELIRLKEKILENNQKQARNEEDNLIRRYMNEGLAKFGDILRSKNSDIHLLGDAFISEIVKYLNAIQGGLFIYDDSNAADPVLSLISAFAYDRKKYLTRVIKMGEGLVGSCAKEKQYMNMTEIPEGYISITSGLGDTPPGNLLLVPVLHENEILGVVEIASLTKFKNHEIEFVQEVAYSLGSTLVTTRNNQRTTELLQKSQQQALEMSEQEEEMRQNMEELKATQEESARREEELSGIAEALGTSMMVIEYNLEGQITEANQNACRFLGKEPDEIIGKLHQEVFSGDLTTNEEFWKKLRETGSLKVSESIKIGRKSYDITEHFARVNNRDSITVKYINFATDGRIGNS